MASHDVAVLAGRVGSSKRTSKINNMVSVIDKLVRQAEESDNPNVETIQVRSGTLAERMNWSKSTICRNGFPEFFTTNYDGCEYKENKGIYVDIETWKEERKRQREELSNLEDG